MSLEVGQTLYYCKDSNTCQISEIQFFDGKQI